MSAEDPEMSEKRRMAEDAAGILRRLDEKPDDPAALRDREVFLARGPAEQRIYASLSRGFAVARQGLKARDRRYVLAMGGALLAALALAWSPLRVAYLADHRSAANPQQITLSSGDVVTLDASSAIQDDTSRAVRAVTLIEGAAFFDVDRDGRRFVVHAGDVAVEVIGTAFEVSRLGDIVLITVAEGAVEVHREADRLDLRAGDQLRLSQNGLVQNVVSTETIADWRRDLLTMDGLTLANVARVIDRRLPGRVIVMGQELQGQEVAGGLDLTEPANALVTLAATSGARVITLPNLVTLLYQPSRY